jgi:hypothetical protein
MDASLCFCIHPTLVGITAREPGTLIFADLHGNGRFLYPDAARTVCWLWAGGGYNRDNLARAWTAVVEALLELV